ncbi:MAG: hypothetical protein ACRD5R_09815 [Candidatus Acidiferrales bacterium]
MDLDPHRDRSVLFGMAVTSRNEVLSFVAKDTGNWKLYLASNWLNQNPAIEEVPVPGFFSKLDYRRDGKSMETMNSQVFATRDGKFAVCVGSAMWLKRVGGRAVGEAAADEVIAVVDLSRSKIVAATNTADLDLFGARGVTLDDDGFLRIESLSVGKVRQGAFIRLSIPSLRPGPKCSYDWIVDSPGKEHPQATTTKECSEIIGSRSLADYLNEGQRRPAARPDVCENNQSEFCRLPGEFTPDSQFGVALRTEGHDNFWGSWVVTSNSYIIFSTSRRVDIGEIKEPTNDSFQRAVTTVDRHNYLLVLQSGTHLTAYELKNQSN